MCPSPPVTAVTSKHRVLCIGDMTADVLASPMPKLPQPGEVSMTDRIVFCPGGNALNSAIALRRLGESVRFVGSLGDDAFGDLLMAQLDMLGLDLRDVRREPGCATPTTLVERQRRCPHGARRLRKAWRSVGSPCLIRRSEAEPLMHQYGNQVIIPTTEMFPRPLGVLNLLFF